MTRRQLGLAAVVLTALVLASDRASAQCVMCKTLLATPEGQKLVAALRSGILLLLAAPFAIFGTVATLAVRAQRRRQRLSAHGKQEETA